MHNHLAISIQGWLLCHNPSSGCTDYFAGSYAYLDLGNSGAVDFLKNMVADIVRGYPSLDGFQFDDHFSLPNDFASVRLIRMIGLEKNYKEGNQVASASPAHAERVTSGNIEREGKRSKTYITSKEVQIRKGSLGVI